MKTVKEEINWPDYALLDSGDFEKFERFGDLTVVRPEPSAIWHKDNAAAWAKADLVYQRISDKKGEWAGRQPPAAWSMRYGQMVFHLRPTSFKHVGVFPEQAANWEWIQKAVKPGDKVLNLFAYTGGASLAAALAGASVTHVDGSKPAVDWAKENAQATGVGDKIRFITDDAGKFAAREARRGNKYEAIFLDPPAFGHGPKNELWKFEEDLPKLLENLGALLSPKRGCLLLNTYALSYPGSAMEQLLRTTWPKLKEIESVETVLSEQSKRGFELLAGLATRARW